MFNSLKKINMKTMKKKVAFLFAVMGLGTSLMFVSPTPAVSCGSFNDFCVQESVYICKQCSPSCGLFGYKEYGSQRLCTGGGGNDGPLPH